MQVQSKTEVVARIIHSFILDLGMGIDIELFNFSTPPIAFNPISLFSFSFSSSLLYSQLFLSILHISLLFPPCNQNDSFFLLNTNTKNIKSLKFLNKIEFFPLQFNAPKSRKIQNLPQLEPPFFSFSQR
jgi:hypothetical protein